MAAGFQPGKHRARAGKPVMGIQHLADGGIVKSITGMLGMHKRTPEELRAADAARMAKMPPAAQPAPAPAPAPDQSAITGYAGMTAMQQREKAAGLKDGGAVKGSGTETSDSIPVMASKNEYMLPADTTRALGGAKVLDKIVAATHTPSGQPAVKLGFQARADGGPIADGEKRRKAALQQIPTGGHSPAPAAQPENWSTGTELGRNVSNTISALPMVAPAIQSMRTLGMASRAGQLATAGTQAATAATGAVAPYAIPAAGAAALANASSPADAAAPVARPQPAAQTGAQHGSASAPSDPLAPTAPAAGPTASLNDPNALNNVKGEAVNGAPSVVKLQGGMFKNPMFTDDPVRAANEFKQIGLVPGAGAGTPAAGTPPPGMGFGGDAALSAARRAAADRGDFAAVRDSYQQGGGTFAGETRSDTQMQDLQQQLRGATGKQAEKLLAMMNILKDQKAAQTTQQNTEAEFGLKKQAADTTQTAAGFQARSAKRIEDLQNAYEAAPAEAKSAIAEQLRVLTGKDKPAQWKALALQGGTDSLGNKTEGVLAAVNEHTGEVKRLDSQASGAVPLQNHVDALKKNPALAASFDQQYGKGAAAKIMGNK